MNPDSSVLRLEKISRSFGRQCILREADLSISSGEIIALLGVNGAGKTTLLRIMAGLLGIDSGHVFLHGEELDSMSAKQRTKLMHLPDFPAFVEHLTLLQNIALFLNLYEKTSTEAEERAIDLLKNYHLLAHARKAVGSLSRGQRYKLALTCWAAVRPDLALLDEPFAAGMDHQGLQFTKKLIRSETEKGASVVYTTQFVDYALDFSDRVVLIADESLYFVGSAAEFRLAVASDDQILATFKEEDAS